MSNDFEIRYGIIATVPHPTEKGQLSVLQFIGFKEEPDDDDFKHIYAELKSDPDVGLGDIDFDLYLAPEHVVTHFKKLAEEENYGEPIEE